MFGSDWPTVFPMGTLTRAQGWAQLDQGALMRKEVGKKEQGRLDQAGQGEGLDQGRST